MSGHGRDDLVHCDVCKKVKAWRHFHQIERNGNICRACRNEDLRNVRPLPPGGATSRFIDDLAAFREEVNKISGFNLKGYTPW